MAMDEPPMKKSKANAESNVLHPDLIHISDEKRNEIREKCMNNTPFPHFQIPALCTPEHMLKVHTECVEQLQSTFKQTDLFKLYQTIDLANLDEKDPLAKKIPSLMQLRNALYTPEFRQFMSDITGCGPLTDKVDCAANVYMNGCHLLPHDDVIGTRCISYVIYLSDPDDEWKAQDGGALELYPEATPGIPALIPTAFALPSYNTLALFPVAPGLSFHSVQEVYADKPRLSIQGWFHKETPPSGVDVATSCQLQAIQSIHLPFESIEVEDSELTQAELNQLNEFLNEIYLRKSTLNQIRDAFRETGSLQLQDIFKPKWAEAIAKASQRDDEACSLGQGRIPSYTAGYDDDWEAQGPVFQQRYLRFVGQGQNLSDTDEVSAGKLLQYLQTNLLSTAAFHKWLNQVSCVFPVGVRSEVRRFRAGLDYTLAAAPPKAHPILDAVICFCREDPEESEETWSSGFECYMPAKEDGVGDVADGDEDEDGAVQIPAQNNTLSIVIRDTQTMKFVKFISAREPGSRWDLSVEYQLSI